MKLCFLDLETTGFDEEKDSIIEISFVIRDQKNLEILDKFDEVIVPQNKELSYFISHLTGITKEEISQEGKNLSEVLPVIQKKLEGCVIVGHNIDFDINFLKKNGVDLSQNQRIDTHELARILLPKEKSFALEILSAKYNFLHEDAHRAMSDVMASIELFDFLLKKIEIFPIDFLQKIRNFLENKTSWFAKKIFIEALEKKINDGVVSQNENLDQQKNNLSFCESARSTNLPEYLRKNFDEIYEKLKIEKNIFIRQGDSTKSAKFTEDLAKNLEEKILIISPKLNFFDSEIKKFPIPEILFDKNLLQNFVENRETLDNAETTFYLKCVYRDFLGYRGLDFFDLFFKEKKFWQEVCVKDENDAIFFDSIEKRKNEKILLCTPDTFFRFHDHEILKNRILFFDETEMCAKKLLFFVKKETSLLKFLESKDEKISVKTHFFITDFCKNFIEKKLNHAINPFPQKILLDQGKKYENFANQIKKISDDPEIIEIANILLCQKNLDNSEDVDKENFETDKDIVRWVNYFPDSGNLSFGKWDEKKWEDLKNKISQRKKIIFYRHKINNFSFFFNFLNINSGHILENSPIFSSKKINIPKNLKSANSPEFNEFCANIVIDHAKKFLENTDKKGFVINFSSQETLKKIFNYLIENSSETTEKFSLLGEGISGGDSKITELLKIKNKIIFFTKAFIYPEFDNFSWQSVFIQKFPFEPPHPLLEHVENLLKSQNKNFWSIWIVPTISANLSRRISAFSDTENIFFIDPRENTRWGKQILDSAFK